MNPLESYWFVRLEHSAIYRLHELRTTRYHSTYFLKYTLQPNIFINNN